MRSIAPEARLCPSGTLRRSPLDARIGARVAAMTVPMAALILALLATGSPTPAQASEAPGAARLRAASAQAGQKLIAEHNCSACHARKVGGDGSSIYRPKGRINTPSALLGMVEMCNTELGLQMFPEDVADVAAALNARHYRFKLTPP